MFQTLDREPSSQNRVNPRKMYHVVEKFYFSARFEFFDSTELENMACEKRFPTRSGNH